jgi:hypothetical protein
MSWADWFAHVKVANGYASGGIYTFQGACCHQEGVNVNAQTVQAITESFKTGSALPIGNVRYQVLQRTDEFLQARKDGVPVCVYKTNTMYLVVIGKKDASPAALSASLGKAADTFKSSNL